MQLIQIALRSLSDRSNRLEVLWYKLHLDLYQTEAIVRGCSVRKVLLKTGQNSQENTCVVVFFNKVVDLYLWLLRKRIWHNCFPMNFAKNFENTCFYRTPLVDASDHTTWLEFLENVRLLFYITNKNIITVAITTYFC